MNFLLIIIVSFSSCKQNISNSYSSSQKDSVVKTKTCWVSLPIVNPTGLRKHSIETYNKKGQIQTLEYYDPSNEKKINTKVNYVYKGDKLIEESSFHFVNKVKNINYYDYNSFGQIIRTRYYSTQGIRWDSLVNRYDSNSNLVQTICYSIDTIEDIKYEYNDKKELIRKYENFSIYPKEYTYTYSDGLLIEETQYNRKDNSIETIKYIYNKNRNVIEVLTFTKNSTTPYCKEKYEYEYFN